MDVSRHTTRIPVTAEALSRAMRRMLTDDSKVHVSLDGRLPSPIAPVEPRSRPPAPRTVRIVPILPEARAKAIRRSLREESQVLVRVTDPRRG